MIIQSHNIVTCQSSKALPAGMDKEAFFPTGGQVIEKYELPSIQIFDKNCPLKRVNQKFAIFWQNVRKLKLFLWYISAKNYTLIDALKLQSKFQQNCPLNQKLPPIQDGRMVQF